ncbi:CLUMA_CG019582, isoform A [Clunio marinus]|uniref:CLUMA_CG019582, isoform A n=1 Tax=Clunio marinus TaxID=568069 RepID=A0A1J1J3B9_9DIPT|nr:CLUMA_CG019582, isoform A [Clunio marinus]
MSSEQMENSESSSPNKLEKEINQKSPFTTSEKAPFNIEAAPFKPPSKQNDFPIVRVGPSKVAVNGKIWDAVAANRSIPSLPQTLSPLNWRPILQPPYFTQNAFYAGYNHPPAFEDDLTRNLVFTRNFGPVAHPDGFVELRLRENISVMISLDRSILIHNPKSKVKIAVNGNMTNASLEHPNGKVFQQFDRVDIMAFDGSKRPKSRIRYAKMWEKGVSLTADGCALIYLVDTAGTRTTSDPVNKDTRNDYSWQVFIDNCRLGEAYYDEADVAAKTYHFFTQDDGTQVFDILGFRVSQTHDGMVRVSRGNNRLKLHTSPSNGSATLSTPQIHCTASLGQSSHLFVRRDERRMHFDGSAFVVRNAGHSSGFDENNNLRVY